MDRTIRLSWQCAGATLPSQCSRVLLADRSPEKKTNKHKETLGHEFHQKYGRYSGCRLLQWMVSICHYFWESALHTQHDWIWLGGPYTFAHFKGNLLTTADVLPSCSEFRVCSSKHFSQARISTLFVIILVANLIHRILEMSYPGFGQICGACAQPFFAERKWFSG